MKIIKLKSLLHKPRKCPPHLHYLRVRSTPTSPPRTISDCDSPNFSSISTIRSSSEFSIFKTYLGFGNQNPLDDNLPDVEEDEDA